MMPMVNPSFDRRGERGFTLMEILIAMTILVLGGVSIISLFAAAVSLQYDSIVNERQAMILPDIVSEAQQVLNAHRPTKEQPVPPEIERKESALYPNDFQFEVTFSRSQYIPEGEGAIANIRVFFREQELPSITRILQRTVFSQKEIVESITLEQDRRADAEAAGEDEDDG